jgi:hypothetical protein
MYRKLICLISFALVLGWTGIASAELVMYWPLDEGSGTTAVDVTGNGHDGTIGGTAKWVTGKNNLALDFDGSSTYIDMDDEIVRGTWSLALWLRPRDIPYSPDTVYYAVMHTDAWSAGTPHVHLRANTSLWNVDTNSGPNISSTTVLQEDEWYHCTYTVKNDGSSNNAQIYINGVLESEGTGGTVASYFGPLNFGAWTNNQRFYHGLMDDIRVYDHVLPEVEVLGAMAGKVWPYASGPNPEDGALHADTWVSISWKPGGLAVSHDVYFSDNFDDVNEGLANAFQGNQGSTYFVAGFPGFPYPDGLVNGTTYYWRIDEVNDADPNSPWKGDVWSFMVPPKTAYDPVPANGAEFVPLNAQLKWTPGYGAKLHYVVFGEDQSEVSSRAAGVPSGPASYSPVSLKLAKTYYWRIDEFDGAATHKGEVWSFTTEGAVTGPNPADGAVDVKPSVVLKWNAGAVAASHEVYFGADANTVENATKTSPEYKGPKALGEESYTPGKLIMNTTYYWRIDEVNDSPESPWAGNVWSFTTGDFFVIDDFEDYNAGENQIWYAWHDGLGYGAPGTADYYAGNGTGAAVGDETTASYTEETIVHGGDKSMPVAYDNNKQGSSKYSEVEYKLTDQRDWTEQGVTELSLWFRGYSASVGSFVEGPAGTYTMTGSGADIWDIGPGAGQYHDEFHFAYKMLTGPGSIVAKVNSVQNTNEWAKACVMIRETLEGGSKHALAAVTPANGVAFQSRSDPGGASSNTNLSGFTAPYWVRLTRDVAGNFSAYHSANGTTWLPIEEGAARNIPMTSNVYIGLALTSHNADLTCQAVFSNVTFTGTVSGQWANQDIGIISNDAEPLYVAVSNTAGTPAVAIHDDPAASIIDTWTEWVIPLQAFADQGIDLTNVDKIAIGLGTKGNVTVPGGSGKMFFDDIRLNRPTEAAGE